MVKSAVCLVLLALLVPSLAHAEEAPAAPKKEAAVAVPALHHAPHVSARADHDIDIEATIDRPDLVKRALLVFRGQGTAGEVELARSSNSRRPYVAVIPGAAVRGPYVAYAIELETATGERVPVFASRDNPHPVTVLDSAADAREAVLLARLDGRRSVVQTSGEWVNFGTSRGDVSVIGVGGRPATTERRSVDDRYYRIEGSYTYRLLGTVSEFGLRAGVVRGSSLVPGESDPSKYDVGLNYGAPRVRLRLDDWAHLEGELLISVTEVGFSTGAGGALLLGDAYGSHLTLGVEAIDVFGTRGYTRLDVVANRRLSLAPIVEVTNMPHADAAGVRLLTEAAVTLAHGFKLTARGGYQARTFDRGGPTLGVGLAYAF